VLTLWSVWVLTPQVKWWGYYTVKEHCPSDETLNRGPDSLGSWKIPRCPSKKTRGLPPASRPNLPISHHDQICPSWPPNHPHIFLIGFITVSSPPVCWCVVSVLTQFGCCHITLHIGGVWGFSYVKLFEYAEKHYMHIMNYYYYHVITMVHEFQYHNIF